MRRYNSTAAWLSALLLAVQVSLSTSVAGPLLPAASFTARLPLPGAADFTAARQRAFLAAVSQASQGPAGKVTSVSSDGAALSVTARVLFPAGGLPSAAAFASRLRKGGLAAVPQIGAARLESVAFPYLTTSAGAEPGPSEPGLTAALMFTAVYSVAPAWATDAKASAYRAAMKALLPGLAAVEVEVRKEQDRVYYDTQATIAAGKTASVWTALQQSLKPTAKAGWPSAAFPAAAVKGAALHMVCSAGATTAWCSPKPPPAAKQPPPKGAARSPPPRSPPLPRPPALLPPPPTTTYIPVPTITGVESTDRGVLAVSLSVSGSAGDGGHYSFLVTAKAIGCTACPDVSQRSTTTPVMLPNLTVNQNYVLTAVTIIGGINSTGARSATSISFPATPANLLPAPRINGILTSSRFAIVFLHLDAGVALPSHPMYTVTAAPADGSTPIVVVSETTAAVFKGLSPALTYSITAKLKESFTSLPARQNVIFPYPNASIRATPSISEVAMTAGGATRVTLLPPLAGVSPAKFEVTAKPGSGSPIILSTNSTLAYLLLDPNVAYVITAVGIMANSTRTPTSPAVRFTTLRAGSVAAPADAPAITSVTFLTRDSIVVEFSPPSSSVGGVVTYTVFAIAAQAPTVTVVASSSPVALDHMMPGTTYTLYVMANTATGASLPSSPKDFTLPKSVANMPVVARMWGANGTLFLTGDQVEVDGGCTITMFEVHCDVGGPYHIGDSSFFAPTVVNGLVNDRLYHCFVESYNCNGHSEASDIAYAMPTANAKVPDPPKILVVTPYWLTSGSIRISWSQPFDDGGRVITAYLVSCSTQMATVTRTEQAGTFSSVLSGLAVGGEYFCSVAAVNDVGRGLAGTPVLVIPRAVPTAPGQPEIVLVSPRNGGLSFKWLPPLDMGDAALSSYLISCGQGALPPVTVEVVANPPSPYGVSAGTSGPSTVMGLTNGLEYNCTISTSNGIGTSAPSAPLAASPSAVATSPSAPEIFSVTPGDGSLLVHWLPPKNDGGQRVTTYLFYWRQAGAPVSWNLTMVMSSPALLPGLENGVSYQLYVLGSNGDSHGHHNASQHGAASATVLASPSAVPTVPGPPRAVSVTAGHHSALLTWKAPLLDGGARVVRYEVSCGSDSSPSSFSASVPVTRATLMGLVMGVEYRCTVAATNVAGTGPPGTLDSIGSTAGQDDHEHR